MLKKKRNIIDMCQEDGGTDRSTFRRVHRGEISGQIQGEILTNNFDFGGKLSVCYIRYLPGHTPRASVCSKESILQVLYIKP